MKMNYKICSNKECEHILGCNPKYKKCPICGSTEYDCIVGDAQFRGNPYWERTYIGIVSYHGSNCHIVHLPDKQYVLYCDADDEDLKKPVKGQSTP